MIKKTKRALAIFVILILCIGITTIIYGEGEPWDCRDCNRTGNTGNFCGGCGHPAPWIADTPTPEVNPTATPTPAPVKLSSDAKVGDIVLFGRYEQDNNAANGPEDIEWIVLDVQDGKALLISKYGLDVKSYGFFNKWDTSGLREWLNEAFLNEAFNSEEQGSILLTKIDNGSEQDFSGWHVADEEDTFDYVFLLSYAEAKLYFDVEPGSASKRQNVFARISPTTYAVERGAYANNMYKTIDGDDATSWWLRSPGHERFDSALVSSDGSLSYSSAYHGVACIRPALWINMETTTKPIPEKLSSNAKVGDTILFGRYPQTEEGTDETPIEWIVLDVDEANHRALLISKYGLDAKPYNTQYTSVTWETCSLRVWLNNGFLNRAFTAGEQSAILLTDVGNSSSQGYWSASGGNNTQDRIFLLSYAEVNRYLNVTRYNYNFASRVAPTAYAIKQGAYRDSSTKTEEGSGTGWWWLRSPGYYQHDAAGVCNDGSLYDYYVSNDYGCVRPAFWIILESGIF